MSECVQDFYQSLSERLHTQFKGTEMLALYRFTCAVLTLMVLLLGSSEYVEGIMDEVERYMTTRLYKEVFCPETSDDEKKDLAVQKRIRFVHGRRSRHSNCHYFRL